MEIIDWIGVAVFWLGCGYVAVGYEYAYRSRLYGSNVTNFGLDLFMIIISLRPPCRCTFEQ